MANQKIELTHRCGFTIGEFGNDALSGIPVWCPACRQQNALYSPEFSITVLREDESLSPDKADEIIRLISGACQSRGIPPMVLLNMILQLTKSIGMVIADDDPAPIPWIMSLHEAACRLMLADPGTARQ